MWYDQNTAKFDENELRTQLGGIKGTGFDAKGNVVLNVSHMTPDGSFHNELSANAQELMKNGQLKMLFSMSNGTQNKVFEFTVTPKGEIIIPPDSDCAKFLWSNVNGHATFHGRFGEVAQDMGNGNYRMLGTMEGKGLKDIIDTIHTHSQETLLQPNGSYDWTPPPFIPIVPGDPLEKLSKEKKAQEAVGVKDRSGQDKKPGDVIIGPVGPWSTEENKKKIELSQEEYNAMADDVKMLNRKRQLQDGIATITEADFKSAYGKKRYNDLKHFADGIPAEFNHTELLVIGDEIENILRNAKIIKKEDINGQANSEATLEETEKQKLEKNNVRADLEMLNKKIQSGEGIATLIEDDFQSEYGKNRYNILKHFAEATFNKDELEKIATEMEKILVGSRKIVAPVAKESTTANNTIIDYGGIDDSGTIKKQEKAPIIPEKKETPNPKEIKISGLANPSSGENTKVKPKIQAEEIKPSAEKSIPIERKFTAEDLSRIGTEFESKIGSYKVTRVFRPGLFGKKKIEVLFKDEKGKDHPLAYDKKELEGEFKKGNIKITKAGN
jgi:hypothetical protein